MFSLSIEIPSHDLQSTLECPMPSSPFNWQSKKVIILPSLALHDSKKGHCFIVILAIVPLPFRIDAHTIVKVKTILFFKAYQKLTNFHTSSDDRDRDQSPSLSFVNLNQFLAQYNRPQVTLTFAQSFIQKSLRSLCISGFLCCCCDCKIFIILLKLVSILTLVKFDMRWIFLQMKT